MFGRRRIDEAAWYALQHHMAGYLNQRTPELKWYQEPMLGRVDRVYQHARGGTKVIVDFGGGGRWDTWWPNSRPSPGHWVLVDCHLWYPPGTHSGRPVVWIDAWHQQWSDKAVRRAKRHERRLDRGSIRTRRETHRPRFWR